MILYFAYMVKVREKENGKIDSPELIETIILNCLKNKKVRI